MRKLLVVLSVVFFGSLNSNAFAAMSLKSFRDRPKLVVVIVIDQFRADYLTRFEDRFLALESKSRPSQLGGFNYLMGKSAYFPFAKYDILQSMTCPGHSTILTGSYPYTNGISLNDWFDRDTKKVVYCADDPASPLIGAKGDGASPLKLHATTVSDEVKNAGFKSKVVAVALKDRSAIMLGGHRADAAYWFDSDYKWISSQYYFKDGKLPPWVEKYNKELASHKGEKYIFKASGEGSGHSEINLNFSRETTVGAHDSLSYPLGAKLTTDMAVRALQEYKLGQGDGVDFLDVSYSSHDMLGHETSLNNREMEEMTVAEDQTISDLINAVRKSTGTHFKDVVFVLTADHGVAPSVNYLKDTRIASGFINSKSVRDDLNKKMSARFGHVDDEWVLKVQSFNFYLNLKAAQSKKIAATDLEEFVKGELLKLAGVAYAFSKSDFLSRNLPPGQFERQILKTYNPLTSGDVILIPQSFFVEDGHNSTHMTGYNYDRTVPLLILSKNLKPGVYSGAVEVVDLAPTLSFLLGVLPPALSEGRVLSEAFIGN